MLNNQNQSESFGGHVYVERDGQYQLEPLDNLTNGDLTYWGKFHDITMHKDGFYYSFMKAIWDKNTEQYIRKPILISVDSLVHPNVNIHDNVTIEPGAVVEEGAELLSGAIVKSETGIRAKQKYHHLMADNHLLKNRAAVLPETEAARPNPSPADALL